MIPAELSNWPMEWGNGDIALSIMAYDDVVLGVNFKRLGALAFHELFFGHSSYCLKIIYFEKVSLWNRFAVLKTETNAKLRLNG